MKPFHLIAAAAGALMSGVSSALHSPSQTLTITAAQEYRATRRIITPVPTFSYCGRKPAPPQNQRQVRKCRRQLVAAIGPKRAAKMVNRHAA